MKHSSTSGVIAALLIALSAVCVAETPREFARRFCASEDAFGRGVPDASSEARYDHLVGIELIRSIRAANQALTQWMHRHRDSKKTLMVPHVEANLFSGFSDGPTPFRVGRVTSLSGRTCVAIHREYKDQNETYSWTDILILDHDSAGWVAYDMKAHHFGSLLAYFKDFRKSVESTQTAYHDKQRGEQGVDPNGP